MEYRQNKKKQNKTPGRTTEEKPNIYNLRITNGLVDRKCVRNYAIANFESLNFMIDDLINKREMRTQWTKEFKYIEFNIIIEHLIYHCPKTSAFIFRSFHFRNGLLWIVWSFMLVEFCCLTRNDIIWTDWYVNPIFFSLFDQPNNNRSDLIVSIAKTAIN